MSNTVYYFEVLKTFKEIEGATYLTPEEKSVFASKLLSELKPNILTPGCDELRRIVTKKFETLVKPKEPVKHEAPRPDVQRTTEEGTPLSAEDEHSARAAEDATSGVSAILVEPRPDVQSGNNKTKAKAKAWKTRRT